MGGGRGRTGQHLLVFEYILDAPVGWPPTVGGFGASMGLSTPAPAQPQFSQQAMQHQVSPISLARPISPGNPSATKGGWRCEWGLVKAQRRS